MEEQIEWQSVTLVRTNKVVVFVGLVHDRSVENRMRVRFGGPG